MATETKARNKANQLLGALPNYHRWIPVTDINEALVAAGFREMEDAIYCGREGRVHEQVGEKTWISLTWYRMENGTYEIVTYVS